MPNTSGMLLSVTFLKDFKDCYQYFADIQVRENLGITIQGVLKTF